MAAVSTNVSMSADKCKTLAHSPHLTVQPCELEWTLALVILRPSGELPMLSRGPKRRDASTRGLVTVQRSLREFFAVRGVVPRLL
jgi:hypothetical protein